MEQQVPWYVRQSLTQAWFNGKTLAEVGWPEEWTHDVARCIWTKDNLVLSDKTIREAHTHKLPSNPRAAADGICDLCGEYVKGDA